MSIWDNRKITLNDCWGPAAQTILRSANGGRPAFTLRPVTTGSASGAAQYVVEVAVGEMVPGWAGVIFTATGTVPFAGLENLPQWDPSQESRYRQQIANSNCDQSGTTRLEGLVPFTSNGAPAYDVVCLYYASGVVVSGPYPDLVVVRSTLLAAGAGVVRALQDGTAHGPPH